MKAIKLDVETVVQPDTITLEIETLEERIAPSQPPGLLGFEGQPGNQGGGGGLQGYEGQPGNQGG